jgi:hypothetical protein
MCNKHNFKEDKMASEVEQKAKAVLVVMQLEGVDLAGARDLMTSFIEGMFQPLAECRIGALEIAHLDTDGGLITDLQVCPETDEDGAGCSCTVDDNQSHDEPDNDVSVEETVDRVMAAIDSAAKPLSEVFFLGRETSDESQIGETFPSLSGTLDLGIWRKEYES